MTRVLQFLMALTLVTISLLAISSCGSASADCSSQWLPEKGERGEQFSSSPKMMISTSCKYTATLATTKGVITIALNAKAAPLAVNNFVFLTTHKFYTNILFPRVLVGFMIQTGDPTGTLTGGPGYSFKIENSGSKFTAGTVAMANTGQPDSNGSQFFICDEGDGCSGLDQSWSKGTGYTILGQVTSGMSVVHTLATVPVQANPQGEKSSPITPIYLQSVRIHRAP